MTRQTLARLNSASALVLSQMLEIDNMTHKTVIDTLFDEDPDLMETVVERLQDIKRTIEQIEERLP